MASEVGGFRTICVKFNEKCSSYHFLYFKKHSMRDEDATKPSDKTLFVVNIPPYCTKVRLLCLNTCLANTFFFTTCIKNQALYIVEAHWCSSWRVGFDRRFSGSKLGFSDWALLCCFLYIDRKLCSTLPLFMPTRCINGYQGHIAGG